MKDEEFLKKIGRNITQLREEAGITMNRASQLALVKWAQYRDIEAGKVGANIKTYKKIADALKVDIHKFFIFNTKK